MIIDTNDILTRFHRTLVEEIRNRRPEYLRDPFTVAEIYQNLVPYGTHRDRLGIEMNGDYEDALLRILAGEGGYLILESEPALRVLRQELESSNPNTGVYREYAAVDVRLDPARLPFAGVPTREAAPAATAEEADEAISVDDLAPEEEAAAEPFGVAAARPVPVSRDAPEACRWCRAELPDRPNLRFCPFCGTDIHVVPCPECGEELLPDWRFCIQCGAEVAS
jgi:hypothetical protein